MSQIGSCWPQKCPRAKNHYSLLPLEEAGGVRCLLSKWCRATLNVVAVCGVPVAALCLFTSHLCSSFLWGQQHLFGEHILGLSHELSARRGPEPEPALLDCKRKWQRGGGKGAKREGGESWRGQGGKVTYLKTHKI